MTTARTEAASRSGSVAPAAEDFRVTDASAIAALLAQLRDHSTPVILNAPDGTSFACTVWAVDAQAGRLSFSANEDHLAVPLLVDNDEATAVAYLDRVKLQFDAQQLVLVHGADSCALHCRWPRTLYRFQRREGYRVKTLERSAPFLSVRHPSMPEMRLRLRIVDVSIGGCALALPAEVPALQAGTRFHGVRIELDADTRFEADLVLNHISSMPSGSGHRLGCEWLQIGAAAQRALQRYIDNTQRRRRLLALD